MKRNQGFRSACFFFRKFRRKKYSAFNSMHKVVHISNLLVVYILISSPMKAATPDDTVTVARKIDLEEVEVVGQISPAVSQELPRLVTVVSRSESEFAPSHSITDLLRYSGNIDLRQRGSGGIQSDLSIRGGSFDHNLIMLNGISISDPQTGHFSLNLPVETETVSRIEILNGSASRVLGTNAFNGAVNFVTEPHDHNSLDISTSFGEYLYLNNSFTLNLVTGKLKNLFHYNNAYSSGYTVNTDYFRQGFFYQGEAEIGDDQLDIQFGYNSRAFGANSFYTPRYPDQFERNQLVIASLGFRTGKKIKVHPVIYWRRHKDRWEMFREDEQWYRVENGQSISNDTSLTAYDTGFVYTNHHISNIFGAKLNLSTRSMLGVTSLGWHLRSESILSNAIGYERSIAVPVRGYDNVSYTLSDSRSTLDMHAEQTFSLWKFYLSGGLLINWNSYLPDRLTVCPGLDLRFNIYKSLYLTGSYNYSLGLPTFTDLTYNDPANQGSGELRPYTQHSLEGGIKWNRDQIQIDAITFCTSGKDVIDWVWSEGDQKFRPVNIDRYSSRGIELSGKISVPKGSVYEKFISSALISYTFIDMEKDISADIVKYFNLRQKASVILQNMPVRNLTVALNLSFTEREGTYLTYNYNEQEYVMNRFKPYFLADLRISYKIKNISLFAEASNITDTEYIDIGSISQPGRWISGGLKYSLSGF